MNKWRLARDQHCNSPNITCVIFPRDALMNDVVISSTGELCVLTRRARTDPERAFEFTYMNNWRLARDQHCHSPNITCVIFRRDALMNDVAIRSTGEPCVLTRRAITDPERAFEFTYMNKWRLARDQHCHSLNITCVIFPRDALMNDVVIRSTGEPCVLTRRAITDPERAFEFTYNEQVAFGKRPALP
jgi:hypothetical protein